MVVCYCGPVVVRWWWLRGGEVVVVDGDGWGGGMRGMVAAIICKCARGDAGDVGDERDGVVEGGSS